MSWLKKANSIFYNKYGRYCNKCRLNNVEPIPFYKWKEEYLKSIQK